MPLWGLECNTKEYNMIIDSLCKDGMVDDALNCLVEMNSKGIGAHVLCYPSLIHGLCKHGKRKKAIGMQEMLDSGIPPNYWTFNVLVSALSKLGMTKEADDGGFSKRDESKDIIKRLFGSAGGHYAPASAEELLEIMEERGVHPDVVTHTGLMEGYCLQGQMDKAMRLLNTMAERGVHPYSFCYNTLINGYCHSMKLDEAMHLFREMPLQGLERDIITFRIILQGLVQIGNCKAAEEILNEMQTTDLVPDIKTSGLLLKGLCQSGHIDKALLLFQMMENKVVPELRHYATGVLVALVGTKLG
ncbi:hypothetical protein RHMOL_Rhmol08G0199500 [Rhododendron molle]|uniref:Uncharacterized protein n=1 Tax=Rhododendron molle TaxID=49168 RepID=A0ACC0MRM1_RHOML|nr:hypothetical protein RHMOL_Rhmol08G0199500 [Rhododendron molle]